MNGILCLPSTESLKKVLGYLTAGYLFFQASQKDQGLSSAEEPMFLCLVGTLSREFSERGWGINATNSAPFRQGLSHQKSVSTTNRPCQGSGNWQGAWQQGKHPIAGQVPSSSVGTGHQDKHPGAVKWSVSKLLLSLG